MLIEEARLTAGLAHPNVISDDRLLLVMEHVDGCDLDQLIATGPMPPPVAIFIVRELLAGLEYIHKPRAGARGLVHRDVTPHNVLLSRDGAVKLADFGVAHRMGPVTASIPPVGTPGYLSPEQMSGEDLDGRSDLYAAGVILWELLALRRLHTGDEGGSVVPVIPRPSALRPDVPRDLEDVAMELLAFRREDRYQTAEEAIEDLALCQDAPLVGRNELAELLAQRFPVPPTPPTPRRPDDGPITVANAVAPIAPPPPRVGGRRPRRRRR
jgi:serine/threonine-protein kinase